MAGNPTPGDRDAAWLEQELPDASDYEIENFLERVAIATTMGGLSEAKARKMAYDILLERRKTV